MQPKRVALVTGGGKRRVGSFVAEALAERGFSLAIHYRTSGDEARAAVAGFERRGVAAIALPADLADETQVRRLLDDVLSHFGRLDALVHCAAIWNRKRLEDTTAADVTAHYAANTLGTFLCCQHAGLAMTRQADGGCIVTVGDWAVERPYLDYAAYFASKGAIPALTRCFAVELAARNPRVRVNCVLPGPVMLPADLPAAEREAAINGTLVKREGSPEHVAQAVVHLIENDFLTGVCLPVDGGRTIAP